MLIDKEGIVMDSIVAGDGLVRCKWCAATPEYINYHDQEWGFPVYDDQRLFEKLCLESFQSGLSWRTILQKRENFRLAFENFDFNKMAAFTEIDVERLLQDKGIVRHRGKIEAVIHNARCAQTLVNSEGSLAAYIWGYRPQATSDEVVATSAESIALSKDLKKRGWKFVGPTTVYAFMQSMGLVNHHAKDCVFRAKVALALESFKLPT
jgi:DNA-3-methyladenine glycosylase I